MKLFVILFLLFQGLMISCTNSDQTTGHEKNITEKNKISHRKPPSGYSDTLKISSLAAVFYTPDSLQWQQLKLVNDTMTYSSFEHDCFYQMRNARHVITQQFPNVKIIEVRKIRYLSFELFNGAIQLIDLDAVADPCGIFLFDTHKKPHPADMTNIDTELSFYFK